MEQSATINGVVPSKSNSYRIVSFGGHSSLAKTTAMKKYEESFMWQAGKLRDLNIDTLFERYACAIRLIHSSVNSFLLFPSGFLRFTQHFEASSKNIVRF